jgi:hypothetical protein
MESVGEIYTKRPREETAAKLREQLSGIAPNAAAAWLRTKLGERWSNLPAAKNRLEELSDFLIECRQSSLRSSFGWSPSP